MAELGSGMYSQDDAMHGVEPVRTRPRQGTVAAVLLVVFGLLGLGIAWLLLVVLNDQADHGESVNGVLYALVYGQFVVSAAQVGSGLFVWQGKSWARTLAIVICSLNILGGVLSLFSGSFLQAIAGIALNAGLIRILNRPDVRDWCR